MRCSWCGDHGHNRRTCPHRSEQSKKLDPPKRPRSCSWCHSTSHTRPKCERLASDKQDWINKNADYRAIFLEDLKKANLNYGSIFKYSTSEHTFLVESMFWDSIKHDTRWNYNLEVRYLLNLDMRTCVTIPSWFGLEEGYEKQEEKRFSKNIEILSSPNERPIESYIPADWLSGVSGVELAFKK